MNTKGTDNNKGTEGNKGNNANKDQKSAAADYAAYPDYSDYPEFVDPIARPRYTGLATFLRAPYETDLSKVDIGLVGVPYDGCLLYTSPSPRDRQKSRMPSSA